LYRFGKTAQGQGVFSVPAPFPDDPAALQMILRAAVAEIDRLNQMIASLQRLRFGPKCERLSVEQQDQIDQELDDISQRLAEQTAILTAAPTGTRGGTYPAKAQPQRAARASAQDRGSD
jgi:hypothetical protein